MRVVIINGRGGSGKDTVCSMAAKINPHFAVSISTVDIVKAWARTMKMASNGAAGWNGEKDEKGRRLLSQMKDIWEEYDRGPTKWVVKEVQERAKVYPEETIIFIHAREPENIHNLKFLLGDFHPITLLVSRPGIGDLGNHADDDVDCYDYDCYLDNSGDLDDLGRTVYEFIHDLHSGVFKN
jgi:hypothetical protein